MKWQIFNRYFIVIKIYELFLLTWKIKHQLTNNQSDVLVKNVTLVKLSNQPCIPTSKCRSHNRHKKGKIALNTFHFGTDHNFCCQIVNISDKESNYLQTNISEMSHINLNKVIKTRFDTLKLSSLNRTIFQHSKNELGNN